MAPALLWLTAASAPNAVLHGALAPTVIDSSPAIEMTAFDLGFHISRADDERALLEPLFVPSDAKDDRHVADPQPVSARAKNAIGLSAGRPSKGELSDINVDSMMFANFRLPFKWVTPLFHGDLSIIHKGDGPDKPPVDTAPPAGITSDTTKAKAESEFDGSGEHVSE